MNELLRGALVIARRDFVATVFSKSFLLFLLAPLFPVAVGLVFGGLTVSIASRQIQPEAVVAVIADAPQFDVIGKARDDFRDAAGRSVVQLRYIAPSQDEDAQVQRLLAATDRPVAGVLRGGLDAPVLASRLPPPQSVVDQLGVILAQARAGQSDQPPLRTSVAQCPARPMGMAEPQNRTVTAQASQAILFILTILLATMLLSQLIEEKSNKIIEVLAAAVPIGGIFLGKLLAMLAVSLLGIFVWGSAGATAIALLSQSGLSAVPEPAVGWGLFVPFSLIYFAMSYLLLGAIFLGIGGHASSAREVQTLSMPVTMAQIVVFAIAALSIGEPNSARAIGAAAFPLSSPYVMLARAAELDDLWPHAIAIAWQLLWVGLILAAASRLFRRSVLKSGPATARKKPARS